MTIREVTLAYNEQVLAHFFEPHHVGYIEDADGVGRLGDASCGDVFTMYVAVERNRLIDIKYLLQGCGAAVATCSAVSDLAMGMTLDEAMAVTDDDISRELGGLPLEKLHCSNLAATVLHRAIEDYRRRNKVVLRGWRSLYQNKR